MSDWTSFLAALDQLEHLFGVWVVDPLSAVIFFDVWFWDGGPGQPDVKLPLVVLWLMIGATFFTLRFRFINLRGFRHAIDCVRGRYTRPDEAGEISHFQARSGMIVCPSLGLRRSSVSYMGLCGPMLATVPDWWTSKWAGALWTA